MGVEKPDDCQGKTALVTGASSGIGAAIALRLAGEGLRVLLTARRVERLRELEERICSAGGKALVIPADLERESDRLTLFYQSLDLGGVDILVNNAGFGWYGYYQNMPWETVQAMLQINVEAVIHLTHLYLPHMLSRGSGQMINISSIAGSFPNQGIASYSASKAYLNAFSTALHRELRGSGVHVSLVMPGPVATEFFDRSSEAPGGRRIPAERFAVSAERVASRVSQVIRKPRRKVYIPWWLSIVPWIEMSLGWAIDPLGPLLLKRKK